MSCSRDNKENIPPKRKIPWFRHHNPGTRYTYDGPRQPKVRVLSSVVVVPPDPVPRSLAALAPARTRPAVAPPTTSNRPEPKPQAPITPRRPERPTAIPETPRPPKRIGTPRRLPLRSYHDRPSTPPRFKGDRPPRNNHRQASRRPRTPPRRHQTPTHQRRERTPIRPRFRPPPPRSPSPPRRIVVTRDHGMRPDIPWVAPRRLNLIKPSRPRFHDVTGRDPRSRAVQVVVTLPPLDRPVRRSGTPPTPHTSPVPSPVRPLPPTPPSLKVPGPPARSKIVYYRGSLVPGRPRRHISLAYYPQEDTEVRE